MKNLKLLIFCLALLSFAMLAVPVAAQTRTVGVQSGDWFKYVVTVGGDITTIPPPFDVLIGIQWMKVQVTGVSGTNVTGQMTIHYQNGTETIVNGWVDVETGSGETGTMFSDWNGFLIAANLGEGDTTYTSRNIMTINSTIDRSYPGGARATNLVHRSGHSGEDYFWDDFYWDKSTGAMVEMDTNLVFLQGDTYVVMPLHIILVDSQVWVVPEFSPMLMLALFATLTLVAVVYKRKQLKTPSH